MGVTMYSEKKYGILLVLIAGEIAIGLALPRISVGINNPSDERKAALHIMDLIGEKKFNPSRFAGYGNRRIRSIWPVQSARFGETDIVCQNLSELPFVRTVQVGSADFARPLFL